MSVLSHSESEQVMSEKATEGPGAQLRKQRELRGLDQSRVAAQLHLSKSMIEALERDDFDALPGAVFVQGYLRNYARLLGESETELIRAFQEICPEPDHGCLGASASITQEVRSSHSPLRLMTWLILIGLSLLLLFWWQGRVDWESPSVTVQEPDAVVTKSSEADIPRPFGSVPSLLSSEPVEEEAVVSEPHASSSYVEPAEETVSETPLAEPPVVVEPAMEVEVVEVEPVVVSEIIEPQEILEAQEMPEPQEIVPLTDPVARDEDRPPQALPDQLVFEFSGRCWAEVRDVNGKARIIGEMRDGSRRILNASLGPFKIVLGDASVVRLTVAGEPYDLTPYMRGKVARFTLDPASR